MIIEKVLVFYKHPLIMTTSRALYFYNNDSPTWDEIYGNDGMPIVKKKYIFGGVSKRHILWECR